MPCLSGPFKRVIALRMIHLLLLAGNDQNDTVCCTFLVRKYVKLDLQFADLLSTMSKPFQSRAAFQAGSYNFPLIPPVDSEQELFSSHL